MSKPKKNYWQLILEEIKHKDDPNYECKFIHCRTKTQHTIDDGAKQMSQPTTKTKEFTRYYLNDNNHDLYFTERELDCLRGLRQQLTYVQIGHALKLSPRTVEFYVKGMKAKTKCRTKEELLNFALASNVAELINEEICSV